MKTQARRGEDHQERINNFYKWTLFWLLVGQLDGKLRLYIDIRPQVIYARRFNHERTYHKF